MQLQKKKKKSNKEKRGKWSKGYIKSTMLEDRLFVSSQTCPIHFSCLVEHPVMAEDLREGLYIGVILSAFKVKKNAHNLFQFLGFK